MVDYPDIPGIALYPVLSGRGPTLDFNIQPHPPLDAATAATVENLWRIRRAQNPRLFDGPLLAVDMQWLRESRPVMLRWSYKLHVCIPHDTLRSVGVQGLILGDDATGKRHLLLGRRSGDVLMYPGQWENAPSGSVQPPPANQHTVDQSHFVAALKEEGLEELGLSLNDAAVSFFGLLDDAAARTIDIVLRVELARPIDPRAGICAATDAHRWEYADTAWIALDDLPEWADRHAQAISPPTRALVRWCESRGFE